MRSILTKENFYKSLSIEETVKDVRQWLNTKHSDAERINEEKRSLDILSLERPSNFNSVNGIDVDQELLPVKK